MFYDAMFLLGQTPPDYNYLSAKCNIHNINELKEKLLQAVEKTNLKLKSQDFEHLLFNKNSNDKIMRFREFVEYI